MNREWPTGNARSRTVVVDGIRTHYLEAGEGPPLVLLHDGSYGASGGASWYLNIEAWSKSHRVIAPDWLGFGQTDKLHDFGGGRRRRLWHMTRFIEAMDLGPAAFAGVSMGATLLLDVTASDEWHWDVAAVVAISGGGFMPDNAARRATMDFDCTIDGMRRVLAAIVSDPRWLRDPNLVERRFEAATMPGAWEAVEAARFKSPLSTVKSEFGVQDSIAYEKIAAPTLLIAGADDKLREPGYADKVASRLPNGQVKVFANCGHLPQIEASDATNQVVCDFLARHGV